MGNVDLGRLRAELEVLYERALECPDDDVAALATEVLTAFDSIDDRLFGNGSAAAVAFVVGLQLRADVERLTSEPAPDALARLRHEITLSLRTVDDSLRRLSDGDPRESLTGLEPQKELEDALLLRHAYAGLRRDIVLLSDEPSLRARARRAAAALASFLGRTVSSRARLHDRTLLRSLHGRARNAYASGDEEALEALCRALREVLPFLDSISDREVLRRHDDAVVQRALVALDAGDVSGALGLARALYGRRTELDALLEHPVAPDRETLRAELERL